MEDVVSRIQEEINACSYIRGYEIQVLQLDQAIVIRGQVSSYFHKQMAGVEALRLLENYQVRLVLQNEIVVSS